MTPTTQVQTRWGALGLPKLDALVSHFTIARSGNVTLPVSRQDVIQRAVDELYEQHRDAIERERETWAALVARYGPHALLSLSLSGRGDPDPPETHPAPGVTLRTPARWSQYDITATIDGQPADLPLLLEPEGDALVTVCLTDDERKVRIPLGTVSRNADGHAAFFDRRLSGIARDFGLD